MGQQQLVKKLLQQTVLLEFSFLDFLTPAQLFWEKFRYLLASTTRPSTWSTPTVHP
jgi:hypothetical protein